MRKFSNDLYEHLIMLQYRERRKTGVLKKMRLSELRLLMARGRVEEALPNKDDGECFRKRRIKLEY